MDAPLPTATAPNPRGPRRRCPSARSPSQSAAGEAAPRYVDESASVRPVLAPALKQARGRRIAVHPPRLGCDGAQRRPRPRSARAGAGRPESPARLALPQIGRTHAQDPAHLPDAKHVPRSIRQVGDASRSNAVPLQGSNVELLGLPQFRCHRVPHGRTVRVRP